MIIIFEGIDGSGKTTQINLLAKALRQRRIKFSIFKEPTEPFRSLILNYNFEPLVYFFLFQANRAFNFDKIRKIYKKRWILIDRSFPSTFVYQWYLTDLKKKIPFSLLERLNKLVLFNLKPAKIIVFDLPAEVAYQRLTKENVFEQKPLSYFKKLRQGYLDLAKKLKWQIINAHQPPEKIHFHLKRLLKLN